MKTLTLITVMLLTGCSQRIVDVYTPDPNGVPVLTYRYKSNSIATDTSADSARIKLPDGTDIEFNKFKQDNDSVKVITRYGVAETGN